MIKTTPLLTMFVPVLHDLHYVLYNHLSFVLNTYTLKMEPVCSTETQESFPHTHTHTASEPPDPIKAENKLHC